MKKDSDMIIKMEQQDSEGTQDNLVERLLDRYKWQKGMLIPILQDIQEECEYLPADLLRQLSSMLAVPLSRIYSVATFYAMFRLAPPGEHHISLCLGTVCFLKGAGKIAEAIQEEFSVEPGGTSPDRKFTFQPVNCVGACALAPVMVVDGTYYDGVTPESALKILYDIAEGKAVPKKGSPEKKTKK